MQRDYTKHWFFWWWVCSGVGFATGVSSAPYLWLNLGNLIVRVVFWISPPKLCFPWHMGFPIICLNDIGIKEANDLCLSKIYSYFLFLSIFFLFTVLFISRLTLWHRDCIGPGQLRCQGKKNLYSKLPCSLTSLIKLKKCLRWSKTKQG